MTYTARPDLSDDTFTVSENVDWLGSELGLAQRFHIAMAGVSRCARSEQQVAEQIADMRRVHGVSRHALV